MSDQIPEEFICCDGMRGQSKKCSQHFFDCPDNVVKYKDVPEEYRTRTWWNKQELK